VAAGQRYGIDPKLLAAIAMQENVAAADLNPLGISTEAGARHYVTMMDAQAAIMRQTALISQGIYQGKGPYRGVRNIYDLARIYSPVGARNDPNRTNVTEPSGIRAQYKRLGGNPDINFTINYHAPITMSRQALASRNTRMNALAQRLDLKPGQRDLRVYDPSRLSRQASTSRDTATRLAEARQPITLNYNVGGITIHGAWSDMEHRLAAYHRRHIDRMSRDLEEVIYRRNRSNFDGAVAT
jgi:hypothetical protein